MNTEFLETLNQLLTPKQPGEIRVAAATAAAAQTAGPSQAALRRELGRTELGKTLLRRLLTLKSDGASGRFVLTALVNIAEDEEACKALVELNVVPRTIDAILDKDARSFISLHTGLLSNVTRHDAGRNAMVADVLAIARTHALIANIQLIPNILWVSNLAVHAGGRQILLEALEDTVLLDKVISSLRSNDEVRRYAAATTLRNCALAEECHRSILGRSTALGATLARFVCKTRRIDADELLSAPALVREAYKRDDSITPEPAEEIRYVLVETLLLLCKSVAGREVLREDGAYAVLREWHLEEEVERVKDVIESIVNRTRLLDEEDEDNGGNQVLEEPPHISAVCGEDG